MCGIACIFAYGSSAPAVDRDELTRIRESMARRGPDGHGSWIADHARIGLAHRRLAIIDLSEEAAQPMSSSDGRFHIIFNGEIYNYQELRRDLAARGRTFRTSSDTEVLLQLYAERGATMVHALRGMFAFAIWDELERTLFLARDPFGIKPLYYADDGRTLRAASQVKALLAGERIDRAPDPPGHVGFFVLGSVPEPYSLYRSIRAVPAGASMLVKSGGAPKVDVYFDIAGEFLTPTDEAGSAHPRDPIADLRDALLDSVRHHMVADVPVGLFLSAGLDSTTVTTLACEAGNTKLHSLTLGFEEYRGTLDDEVPLATEIANAMGTIHATEVIRKEAFQTELDDIVAAMDQPSIDGVNTYFVSRAAARRGMKVALSGLGGDELFGGYPSFSQVPRMTKLLGWMKYLGNAGQLARRLSYPIVRRIAPPKFAGVLEYGNTYVGAYLLRRALYMPWELDDFLDEATVRAGLEELDLARRMNVQISGLRDPRQIVSTLEMSWYMRNQLLRDADWAGMAHSVEIRVPLVDVELLRTVARHARAGRPFGKSDMARAAGDSLPESIRRRRKTGFNVPVARWAGTENYRAWALRINPSHRRMKHVTVLVTDAFGGRGGIARFNRDLLTAISGHPDTALVSAFPRIVPGPVESMPPKIDFITTAAGNKIGYALKVLAFQRRNPRVDAVVCGHINLLPIAWLASVTTGSPLVLIIHGIEAWQPPRRLLIRCLVRRIDRFAAVSSVTKDRFLAWSGVEPLKGTVLPDAVDIQAFSLHAKNQALLKRLRLENRKIIMTMSRLSAAERYKGHDQVIEAMPRLVAELPTLAYLVVGDGDDRARLEQKVRGLGLQDHVRFAGFAPESEKSDYYSVADAFVMPGTGEGFGIVYLEAMASGLPVLGSVVDGSREALRDGLLGVLIDPREPEQVVRGIKEVLKRPRQVPDGLKFFDVPNFQMRCHRFLEDVYAGSMEQRPA